jgi:hypothetical protein
VQTGPPLQPGWNQVKKNNKFFPWRYLTPGTSNPLSNNNSYQGLVYIIGKLKVKEIILFSNM